MIQFDLFVIRIIRRNLGGSLDTKIEENDFVVCQMIIHLKYNMHKYFRCSVVAINIESSKKFAKRFRNRTTKKLSCISKTIVLTRKLVVPTIYAIYAIIHILKVESLKGVNKYLLLT